MTVSSQEDGLKLGGYLETKLTYFAAEDEITTSNTVFRLEGDYDIGNKGKIESHLIYSYDLQSSDPFLLSKRIVYTALCSVKIWVSYLKT